MFLPHMIATHTHTHSLSLSLSLSLSYSIQLCYVNVMDYGQVLAHGEENMHRVYEEGELVAVLEKRAVPPRREGYFVIQVRP